MNNHDYIDDIEDPVMRWYLTEIKKSDDNHDELINNLKQIQKKLNELKENIHKQVDSLNNIEI